MTGVLDVTGFGGPTGTIDVAPFPSCTTDAGTGFAALTFARGTRR